MYAIRSYYARNDTAIGELARLPGVLMAEGVRDVPARVVSALLAGLFVHFVL